MLALGEHGREVCQHITRGKMLAIIDEMYLSAAIHYRYMDILLLSTSICSVRNNFDAIREEEVYNHEMNDICIAFDLKPSMTMSLFVAVIVGSARA